MCVVNTDATSYQVKKAEKCLESDGREKKKNNLDTFLKQRQNFTPFVTSVDGLLGV